jgi:hypothetical protein
MFAARMKRILPSLSLDGIRSFHHPRMRNLTFTTAVFKHNSFSNESLLRLLMK